MDAFNRPQCLPGTRTEIIKQVVEWALSDSNQNVFWLHGAAGSGKSTISTTIAEHFCGISRLGAYLFFERGKSDPSGAVRTLAYKLATFDSTVEGNVIAAIKRDNDIAQATATTQFENLLRNPLTSSRGAMQGPVVIVLDALDECGTEKSRRSLMQTFRKGLPSLPKNFRFLITSRRESDIDQAFSSADNVCAVGLDHTSTTCRSDVLHYIDYELRNVFSDKALRTPDDWQYWMDRLTEASEGLFVWASTAVKLVDCDNPARTLRDLVSHSSNLSGLDQLYESVLRGSGIVFGSGASKERFSQVLGLILLSRVPLPDDTIDALLGYSVDEPSRLVLSRLQSVLVYTPASPIHFFHTSFRDYLSSPKRYNDPWIIDLDVQKNLITTRCFSVMADRLRFNICDIKSSYIPNDQIPDLSDRIKANIPPHLEYACMFWTQYLHEAQFSHQLLNELSEFLHKRFLYWLEVISLLKKVNTASPALLAVNWVSSHNADVLAYLREARRVITLYSPCISQSIPHIYISALLFASTESKFMSHYLKPDLPFVQIEQRGVKRQSPLLKILTGHSAPVTSVAFSPDGSRVASGSLDKTVRVWDAEIGRIISDPFEGHTEWVRSVTFSPNGVRITSGSDDKMVRIWDIQSGQTISGPFEGHVDSVLSVAFSPDGTRVVSGSADKTIIVWNADTEQFISGHFRGHTDEVGSVTFSPDGKYIASGSDDKTIRIWDAMAGSVVSEPLRGHKGIVTSVAFSPCGTRVVSGSNDGTVIIWNVNSGQVIFGPFERHTRSVWSVAYSPSGQRVVSGCSDRTVWIWDVESEQVVSRCLTGHTECVRSVAFSPDGTRVISGSEDCTVRIWDAESMQEVPAGFEEHVGKLFPAAFSIDGRCVMTDYDAGDFRIWDSESERAISGGHSKAVWSAAFSPDGRCIASGSYDCTIRVWDAESGQCISGPFEGHKDAVCSISFSQDGAHVVSGSRDKTARVWDVESGQAVSGPFEGHTEMVFCVAFSPGGRHIASGSYDKTIILWHVESGKIIFGPLHRHTDTVRSVAFSPDGTHVVSGSDDKTVLIWSTESGQVISGPFEGHTDSVQSVAFSHDGARVVSGSLDATVRVWDVESGQAIFAPLEGHTEWVLSVAFSLDGSSVISGCQDNTIRFWNVKDPAFNWTMSEDGWVHGREGVLLLWIPPDYRRTLWRPQNTAVLNCSFSTVLDFTNAALGERWEECFVPR